MIEVSHYFKTLYQALAGISEEKLALATGILYRAYTDDQAVFVIGNGQSATTASAFALDLAKQAAPPAPKRRFRMLALTDNMAAVTAWANDVSYERIFAEQLESLFRPDDVLIAISASGNSPNVVHAADWVRQHEGKTVALTGFDGGKLTDLVDVNIIVNIADYGHVETAHVAITHYWVDLFRERLRE